MATPASLPSTPSTPPVLTESRPHWRPRPRHQPIEPFELTAGFGSLWTSSGLVMMTNPASLQLLKILFQQEMSMLHNYFARNQENIIHPIQKNQPQTIQNSLISFTQNPCQTCALQHLSPFGRYPRKSRPQVRKESDFRAQEATWNQTTPASKNATAFSQTDSKS